MFSSAQILGLSSVDCFYTTGSCSLQFVSLVCHICKLGYMDNYIVRCCYQMLGHRLFPNVKYSIWVDSKSQFRRDPLGVFEALLWRSNSELAISQHGARSSVYDEAGAVVKKHKATPEEVDVQIKRYRHDHFPDDKRFNGHKGIIS